MREYLRNFNWPVALAAVLLCGLGLMSLVSLSPEGSDLSRSQVSKQLVFAATGAAIMLVTSMIHHNRIRKMAYALYGLGILSLVALLTIAPPVRGVRAWFSFAGFTIQPAEFVKIFVVIALARFASTREEWKAKDLALFLAMAGLPMGLVAMQPDLGMTIVIAFSVFIVMVTSEIRMKLIGGMVLAIVLISPLVYQFGLKEYQKQRILAMVSPDKARAGMNDQQDQAQRLIAIGGPTGRGMGEATNSGAYYLPERHNDFIFTVVGEEMGYLGTFLVMTLFSLILYQCVRVALGTREVFARLCIMGLGSQIFLQVLSNIGMNLGLLPVTGLTLPFMSYGGSSLWANFLLVGVILSVSGHWVPSFSSREMPANQYQLALPRMK
jgi:rod shape determining protein RodA